ncbi:cell division protein FtsA C-terminal domain-containing protein [Streptococcus timonensis]|uniref:cell division protein FtsA C-terminal domain-containing protein n=1 Tax=Streptococcus timonensis TaxID=1852387 RepID=UPI0039C1A007
MDFKSNQPKATASQRSVFGSTTNADEPVYTTDASLNQSEEKPKEKLTDRFRSLIGSMFDE